MLYDILAEVGRRELVWVDNVLKKYGCFPREIHVSKMSYLLMSSYSLVGLNDWLEPSIPMMVFWTYDADEDVFIYDEEGNLLEKIDRGIILNEKIKSNV